MTSLIENSVLEGRYRLGRKLGEGPAGTTWQATDSVSGAKVVVKELLLDQVEDWKAVELFEREGAALRAISHPGVPRYIETVVSDDGSGPRFSIVQAFVEGEDLERGLRGGMRMDEASIRDFLRQIGEVLEYLHGLSPAMIHRDIKPSNIIFSPDNGRYSLIDFGAVQAVQSGDVGGSTVVGTSGYMAAEQLIGRAVPGSDLYALAATAVHLASGVEPWKLPVVMMRLQFRDRVELSDGLKDLLEAMLEPSVGVRMASAGELLARLEGLVNGPCGALEVSVADSAVVVAANPHSPVFSRLVLVGMFLMSPFIIGLPGDSSVYRRVLCDGGGWFRRLFCSGAGVRCGSESGGANRRRAADE